MLKSGDLVRAIDLESVPSAAERLGVSRQRVHQMIDEGKIDFYEYGKRRMLHKRDVDKLIMQRTNGKRAS